MGERIIREERISRKVGLGGKTLKGCRKGEREREGKNMLTMFVK